jgi:MFS superfamily sulfate permease-like transporter
MTTLAIGLASLAGILGLRFLAPKVPGALVLVIGGLIASRVFSLGDAGVTLVGPVPSGLPLPQVTSLDLTLRYLPEVSIAAIALLLIGFSQTAGDARNFATRHRYRINVNQEATAQGMANLGAGFFQGMPVSTSLSASSLNESAGARSPLASITTGLLVIATLIVLAPVFADLPKAVLAAIIIDAVVFGMIDVKELRRLARVKRADFAIAAVAVLGVLSVGVLFGVVIGIGLSLIWLIAVATRPAMPILGKQEGTQVFRDLESHPEDVTFPGIVVLRIDGGLFFATSEALDERIRELADDDPSITTLVLDLEGVDLIDSQGAAKVTEIEGLARARGVSPRQACGARGAGCGGRDRPTRRRPRPRQHLPRGRRGARRARPACRRPAAAGLTLLGLEFARIGDRHAAARPVRGHRLAIYGCCVVHAHDHEIAGPGHR